MYKKCLICGQLKRTTFNCERCSKRICLNCFNFVIGFCADCEIEYYNEKYKEKIEMYKLGILACVNDDDNIIC